MALTDVFFALSDPHRLALVRELAAGPMLLASSRAFGTGVSKSTRSYGVKVLRDAGIVESVRSGRGRLLRLRHSEIDAAFGGLLDVVLRTPAM